MASTHLHGQDVDSESEKEAADHNGKLYVVLSEPINRFIRVFLDLPKYLRGITSSVVHRELQRLTDDVVSLGAFSSRIDVAHTVDILVDFQDRVASHPLDISSIASVQSAWNGIDALGRYEKINSIRLRKLRSCIMLSCSAAWRWLTVVIPEAIADLVHRKAVDCRWLSQLLTAIHEAAVAGEKNRQFYPYHFSLNLKSMRAASIDFSGYVLPRESDFDGWAEFYSSVATEIIEVWLGFPTTGDGIWRGLFALNIVRTLGPEFLLLNYVWDRYKNADYALVRSTQLPELLDKSEYPLLCPTSKLRKDMAKIGRIVNDYIEGRLYRYVDIRLTRGMSIHYASEGMKDIYDEYVIEFKQFVLDCFKVIYRGEHISNNKLAVKLATSGDKFIPFRECGPTRINMCQTDGPFSQKALRTTFGLFSAVVCRAVTFGTIFSRTGRTVFYSPQDFFDAVNSCPGVTEQKHYCDKSAYGGFNPMRNPDTVDVYWKRILESRWIGLDAISPLPFHDAYQYFCPPQNEDRRFLQLGALGSYLITVDYVYAGLVAPPTLEYLGGLVCDLNKGPARALEHMGFVPKIGKKTTADAQSKRKQLFIAAFKVVDKMVKDSIPQEYHVEAGIDMFVTEHSLCKYMRARKKCGLSK